MALTQTRFCHLFLIEKGQSFNLMTGAGFLLSKPGGGELDG
jgi:hypothetical protein